MRKVRKAGGNVIRTSGRSRNHATLTGLTPEQISLLLTPILDKVSICSKISSKFEVLTISSEIDFYLLSNFNFT